MARTLSDYLAGTTAPELGGMTATLAVDDKGRTVDVTYTDEDGRGARFSITHGSGTYTAIAVPCRVDGPFIRLMFSLRRPLPPVAPQFSGRYSAKRLAAFAADVIATIPTYAAEHHLTAVAAANSTALN